MPYDWFYLLFLRFPPRSLLCDMTIWSYLAYLVYNTRRLAFDCFDSATAVTSNEYNVIQYQLPFCPSILAYPAAQIHLA